MTTLRRQIDTFVDHLGVERGLSRNTVEAYHRDLRRYEAFCSDRGLTDIADVTLADLEAFSVALSQGDPPLSVASVTRALVAVRSLHRFTTAEERLASDPAAELTVPSVGSRLPKALSITQIQAMLDTVDTTMPIGLRDKALLELLYGTGARISEIVALDVDDATRVLQASDNTTGLRLIGKGDKERAVPLGSFARDAVARWIERGRGTFVKGRSPGPALFLNARGGRLSRQSAWMVLKQRAAMAGLDEAQVSPHTLRHSYATHLLDGGADVRVVQELLGHASVTTTQLYTLVTVDHLREVYASAHPRAR